jgi:hypothetical protein
MDDLLDALVGFAQEMLGKRGAFYPCAAEVTAAGQIQMVTADLDAHHPSPEEVLDALYGRLRQAAASGEIQAAGACTDVTILLPAQPAGDAIRVDIEHAAADPVRVFLPYVTEPAGGVAYGELVAEPGARLVFTSPAPS